MACRSESPGLAFPATGFGACFFGAATFGLVGTGRFDAGFLHGLEDARIEIGFCLR